MVVGVYIVLFLLNALNIESHNIVGCGGFVKSDIKDFSFKKLSANLIFLDGTVNYITDILPNGAYSIPIYDFGEYILKVVGPKGWTIEPSDGYRLFVEGQDSCNDDYNFKFSGFSIYGKVSTANINQGPSGIRIDLFKDGNIITFTSTVHGGDFIISNVLPGRYELHFQSKTIEGKAIELTDNTYNVEVVNDNVVIEDSFTIHGYPVFGDIHFDKEPVSNVQFYIFSKSIGVDNFNFTKYKCLQFDRKDLTWDGYKALCKSITNEKGEFVFPLLPGGEYILHPIYEFQESKFNIEPTYHEFQITSHSVDLRNHFKISGFSVKGRVLAPGTYSGLSNSEIYVDEVLAAKTNSNGDFILSSVNKGFHKLSVIANGYLFNKTDVQFDPKKPMIGEFYPNKISICGTIIIDTNHISTNILNELSQPRKIVLIAENNGDVVDSTFTDSKNVENPDEKNNFISRFCFYAVPGSYIIKPLIESTISLSLAPNHIKVQLISKPINVKFSQFRGTISGHVKCIERCNTGEFEVTLKSTDESNESSHLIQHILIPESMPNQGTFLFQDIVPGNYQIELISANGHFPSYKNRWCWSDTVLSVTMIDENINSGLVFEQTGFSLKFHSSHNMKVDYYAVTTEQDKESSLLGSKQLSKGVDRICLPKAGVFKLKVDTCHRLANNTLVVDTANTGDMDGQISLAVVQYKVAIKLAMISASIPTSGYSDTLDIDVKGLITYNLNSDPVTKNISWTDGVGLLEFWVEPDTSIQVSAVSKKYLVRPDKINFQLPHGTVDCVTDIGKFELEPGTFIIGSIIPAIQDVGVEVRRILANAEESVMDGVIISTNSDNQGHFSLGPLTSAYKYDIRLVKPGYKFTQELITNNHNQTATSNNYYRYRSLKLAELHVEIVDNVTGAPISGILLSIIGNDLRKNELTDENGRFVFVELTTGTYYLRAMMKELEFDPAGAIEIVMGEGNLEIVRITASRTSFSVYGKVVSLNGEPEPGQTVEAEPILGDTNECHQSLVRNEHGVSDDNGVFRVRGLVPKCNYRLSLKIATSSNSDDVHSIVRSHPRSVTVQMATDDVHNVKLYGLRSLNLREVSAMVWTNNDHYLNSVQVSVFPAGNPDNIVSVYKFAADNVYFQMSVPQVHKRTEYVIRLQSNLSPRLYSNISAQERSFFVDPGTKTFFKYFEFHFYPLKSAIGDSDISLTISSSILLPLLMVALAIMFYQKESLSPLLAQVLSTVHRRLGQLFSTTALSSSSSSTANSSAITLDATDMSELDGVVQKPKPVVSSVPVKKPPFWLRPKKA